MTTPSSGRHYFASDKRMTEVGILGTAVGLTILAGVGVAMGLSAAANTTGFLASCQLFDLLLVVGIRLVVAGIVLAFVGQIIPMMIAVTIGAILLAIAFGAFYGTSCFPIL